MKRRLTYAQLGAPESAGDFFLPGMGPVHVTSALLDEWKSCHWRGAVEFRWAGIFWAPLDIVLLGYEGAAA